MENTVDLAEVRAMLAGARRLAEACTDARVARAALARLERLEFQVGRIEAIAGRPEVEHTA